MRRFTHFLACAALLTVAVVSLQSGANAATGYVNLAIVQGTVTQSVPYIDPLTLATIPNQQFYQLQVYKTPTGLLNGKFLFTETDWASLNASSLRIMKLTSTCVVAMNRVVYKTPYDLLTVTVTKNVLVNGVYMNEIQMKVTNMYGSIELERSGYFGKDATVKIVP